MTLYQENILQLAKSGEGAGRLVGGRCASLNNPLCGDECTLHLKIADGRINAAAHQTRGCVLCMAAAAKLILLAREMPLLAALVKLAQTFETALKDGAPLPPALQLFSPVTARKSRHSCVLLPYQVLVKIAAKAENG